MDDTATIDMPTTPVTVDETHSQASVTVNPARAAAGRLGGQRVHLLARRGLEYEKEHGLKPGRQRLKQLIALGKRYEIEHGLRPAPVRRVRKGDAWQEFVEALARVVKPAHRAAVEQLATTLRQSAESHEQAA